MSPHRTENQVMTRHYTLTTRNIDYSIYSLKTQHAGRNTHIPFLKYDDDDTI